MGTMVTDRESNAHCLELLAAALLATISFAKEKKNIHIHLKMDNRTVLTYINKYGGTASHELNQLAQELWLWCLDRIITLQATHLPWTLNCTADEESRVMKDISDWMLCTRVFSKSTKKWDYYRWTYLPLICLTSSNTVS